MRTLQRTFCCGDQAACVYLKGSLRAVGVAVTPASLLKGLGSPGLFEKSPSLQLAEGGIVGCAGQASFTDRSRAFTGGYSPALILAADWSSRRKSWAV